MNNCKSFRLFIAALFLLVLNSAYSSSCKPEFTETEQSTASVANAGLTIDQLSGCSTTIWGSYGVPERDSLPGYWVGTAFVIGTHGRTLLMFTNRHCLGIDEFVFSGVQVESSDEYGLYIEFPSGRINKVDECGFYRDLDLAILAVPDKGLTEGIDYIIVPLYPGDDLQIGDDVVASGSPGDIDRVYQGTVTFGRVSAFRDRDGVPVIQMDAAINHGNSGGPLLVERDGIYFCVGINTWGTMDEVIEGIGFAIDIGQIGSYLQTGEVVYFKANASGLCQGMAAAGYDNEETGAKGGAQN